MRVAHMQVPLKHGNKPKRIDGIYFPSQAEAARYGELKLLLFQGIISDLEIHPRYPLMVNNMLICTYVADSRYVVCATGERVIEDVKGYATPAYRIKKKLMLAVYNINLHEVAA